MRKRFVSGALWFLLVCAAGRSAQPLDQVFNTDYGFSMRLPADWREVPADVLAPLNEKMSEASHIPQHWQYAYQLRSAEHWLAYPYILVQFYPGRKSEASFKSQFEAKSQMQEELKDASDKASGAVSNPRVGTYYYDEASRKVEFVTEMNLSGIGKSEAYTALKLTENGVIEFCGYCTADDQVDSISFFKNVANNIQLPESSVYKPRILEQIPFLGALDWPAEKVGVVVGFAVGFLLILVFRPLMKKSGPPK